VSEEDVPFERFTEVGRVFRPRASLRENGQIGFNHGCVKRYDMDKYAHVVLFYDAENKRIGIMLTNATEEEGACNLITKSGGGTVSARSFLEYYHLTPKKTNQYDIYKDPESGFLVIQL
jgi:hypothetical protein